MKREGNKVNLFLDSGAFSAFSQDIEINIYDYIKFIKKHEKYITVYANLDVIGDDVATWENQKIMEDAGLSPMPVYHRLDDIKYLHKCLDYPYFGLGGMATGVSSTQRIYYLDKCWDIICDKHGMPKTKVHGFGMTSVKLMLRYPWYSVDSTSWVTTGRMGGLMVPQKKGGEWIFDKAPLKIDVSGRSPSIKLKDQHIQNISEAKRQYFLDYFEENGYVLGKSEYHKEDPDTYELQPNEKWNKKKDCVVETIVENGLSNDYKLRDELNIIYFLNLEKSFPKWPWPMKLNKQVKSFF